MSHVEASRGALESGRMLGEGSSQEDIREVGATGRDPHAHRPTAVPSMFQQGAHSVNNSCRFARSNRGGSMRTSGQCAETGESSCLHREREVKMAF